MPVAGSPHRAAATPSGAGGGKGTISATKVAQMAYVLNKYGKPTTTNNQTRANQQEAVDHALGRLSGLTSVGHGKTLSSKSKAAVKSLAGKYIAEAKANYGKHVPVTHTLKLTGATTAELSGFGVTSKATGK